MLRGQSLSLAHTLTHVTTNVHVCDTTYIPSIHPYACIYRFRLIAFIRIYCTSWGQIHIQQSATNISYTDISLCTGIHKNGSILPHKGIKIYATNSHYHQIAEGKASDNFHLPALSLVCICARNELRGGGKGEGCLGGINILIRRGI